jgi:hypothetical protein
MAGNDWVLRIVSVIIGLGIAWLAERMSQRLMMALAPYVQFLQPRIYAWTYEPILPEALPSRVRRFFDRTGADFDREGFRYLEDVILQSQPRPSYARFFISPDEECLGSVVCHGGIKSFTCTSLADDGTYLETSAVNFGPHPPPEARIRIYRAPKNSVASVVIHHRQQMAEFTGATDVQLVMIEPEDWRTVVEHGHKLVTRDLFARGMIAELPEFAREKDEEPTYSMSGR